MLNSATSYYKSKELGVFEPLHVAFFTRQHNMIQTMKNSLDAEKWLDLLMMPEPEHGDWSASQEAKSLYQNYKNEAESLVNTSS